MAGPQRQGGRVYLAGPEVFLAEAMEIGLRKKHLCARYGFEGVFPIDAEADLRGLSPREAGLAIGRLNEGLIRGCQVVIANITPFRGPSADVGTAYEMGYAAALGLTVCAYSHVSEPFSSRTAAFLGATLVPGVDGRLRDAHGLAVEEWGLLDNLMLESAVVGSGGCLVVRSAPSAGLYSSLEAFEECLSQLALQEGRPKGD